MNPDTLTGWGIRQYDWQWGINVQQELVPRVSVEVGYNRRWFHGEKVTDNQLREPGRLPAVHDHGPAGSAAARRRRLPDHVAHGDGGGRGARRAELRDVRIGLRPGRTSYWHGVDFTVNARLRQGLNFQVGTRPAVDALNTCETTR